MSKRVLLLRSSENPTLLEDLRWSRMEYEWIDAPMPFLAGHGELPAERDHLLTMLRQLRDQVPGYDTVCYARAYGAFSAAGAEAVASVFSAPVVTTPAAVLSHLAAKHWTKLFVVTPYGQARHDYELRWVRMNGLTTVASACLGYDDGDDISRLSFNDIAPAIETANRARVDAVYVACTVTRFLRMAREIRARSQLPVVSATEALLWQIDQLP